MQSGLKNVFIVEKDKTLVYTYRILLEEAGYKCGGSAGNIEEARKLIPAIPMIDIVLLDVDPSVSIDDYINFSEFLYNTYNILVLYMLSDYHKEDLHKLMTSSFYGYIYLPAQTDIFQLSIEFAQKKYEYEQKHFVEHKILDNIKLGVIIFKVDGTVIFINESAQNNFKIKPGENIAEYLKGRFFKVDAAFINSILGTGFKEIVLETDYEGKVSYYNLQFSVYNIKKKDTLIYCFISDISSNKLVSNSQKQVNSSLRKVFENTEEGIFIIDRAFKLIDYNEIAEVFFDEIFDRDLSLGMHLTDFFFFLTEEQQKDFTKSLLVVFRGISRSLIRSVEFKNRKFYFKIKLIPLVKDEDSGKYEMAAILIQNITKEQQLEIKINELETELRPLFDSSFQRFYLCDLNYKIISFNKAAFDTILKEFNHKLKKGDSILNFIPDEVGIDKFKEFYKRTLNYEHVFFKIKIHSDTIGDYWNETHMDPVINSKGEIHEVLIWTIDITEQEKNVQALKESEERYSLIANGANDGLWDWDLRNDKVYLSPRWKDLLGYKDEELPNEYGIRDSLIHPEDKEKSDRLLRKFLQGETDKYVNEIRLRHKNGEYIWVLERGVALKDEKGNIVRIAGSITDISEQKKIERQLKEAYLQLMQERQMFIDADIVIFKMKVNKFPEIIYITKNIKKILGYDSTEIISNKINLYSIIHPEDLIKYKKNLVQLRVNKSKHQQFEPVRFRRSDGKYVWLKSFAVISKREKDFMEIQGHFMNVTEIVKARKILTERQKNMLEFISNSTDAIIGINKNLIITDFNRKAESLFKSKQKDIKGLKITEFLSETVEGESWEQVLKDAEKREDKYYVFKLTENNDDVIYLEISINPIKVNSDLMFYLILRDITERKWLEQEILKNKARYEALVNAIPDLIFVLDKDGNYIDYTADEASPLYTDPKIIIGKNLKDFFKDDNKRLEILQKVIETIKTGKLNIVTYEMPSKLGMRKFEARISKMDDTKILAIVRDVTDVEIGNKEC